MRMVHVIAVSTETMLTTIIEHTPSKSAVLSGRISNYVTWSSKGQMSKSVQDMLSKFT